MGELDDFSWGREHAKENRFLGNFEKFYVKVVTLYYDWVNRLGWRLCSAVSQAATELDEELL